MTVISRIAPQGLPAETTTPPPETVFWEGRPGWRASAFRVWHVRLVACWFAVLLGDGAVQIWRGVATGPDALLGEARLFLIGGVTIALLTWLARLTARTTSYTITDRRVVMRFGIALRAKLVIPLRAISHVGVRVHSDQTGDLALRLVEGQSVLYPKLWPHARPWHLLRPEPMLRGIADAGTAGTVLSRAITAARGGMAHQDAMTPRLEDA